MSGWFTTWTFWGGAGLGAFAMAVLLEFWLIKPMGKLLGFDGGVPVCEVLGDRQPKDLGGSQSEPCAGDS